MKFGRVHPYFTLDKIRDLWTEASQHETLFSDHTRGMVEPFLDILFDPRAIIMELFDENEGVPSGLLMMNKIIPGFDAEVHFAQWDGKTRDKEPIYHGLMRLLIEEFDLRRISAMIPYSHRGLERMMKRLGFQQEGVKRKGNIFNGEWVDLALYGILKEEIPDA